MKKVLFVSSEAYPLIKTGGLADVSASLPAALRSLGHDVRLLIPAYPAAIQAGHFRPLRNLSPQGDIAILEGVLPGTEVPVWLLDHHGFFDRAGNPYLGEDGKPWPDNAERFSLLCHVATEIAMNRLGLNWKADLVHCNDWQTGLIPALLGDELSRPATLFTIHNLAYQGNFPYETFLKLHLPRRFWGVQGLEFYGQMSFMKGGLTFADRVNTVSPTYAREIQGSEFGCGLEGLLSHRRDRLCGILNGIDGSAWNPATDPALPRPFDMETLDLRAGNKAALQRTFGLAEQDDTAVLAWVGRLVQQKGIDLLIDVLPKLLELPVQFVIVGSGEPRYEKLLLDWSRLYPDRMSVKLGYDEANAHLIEGGSDLFLMPSRFEPCGLNQMYSQRYGAIPLVRRAGGLADTVEDANATNLSLGTATGIVFEQANAEELFWAIERGLSLYRNKPVWRKMQRAGMAKDFSWERSAQQYLDVYEQALGDRSRTERLIRA